jgi:hypothetical protein
MSDGTPAPSAFELEQERAPTPSGPFRFCVRIPRQPTVTVSDAGLSTPFGP